MSLRKNYLFELMYQIIMVLFPLMTVPYVSRVLGANGVGVFAYSGSIVQYFILMGTLGIGVYGSKTIATVRDDKQKLSRTFFSIFALQIIMSLLAIVAYVLFVQFGVNESKLIMYIQTLALLSCLVDCTWFFTGLEKFKSIVLRNTVVRVISIILLFILVKNPDDLAIYTLIMTGSTLVGQIVLWVGIKDYITYVPITFPDILSHLKPTLVYFIPLIAIQIYFVLNKTMLGVFSTKTEVGLFDYADKLLKVCLTFVTSLGTIMLPKIAYIFSSGKTEEVKGYIHKSLDFSTMIAVPIMFGLAGISSEFIPWYLGKEFEQTINILLIISPTILFMAWSGVFGTQYLLPLGRMKVYNVSVYIGAVINLVMNLFLIKQYGAIGAAISTLAAEFFVLIVQFIAIKREFTFKPIFFKAGDYFIAGIVMYFVVRAIGIYGGAGVGTTLMQISIGAITYLVIVVVIEYYKNDGLLLNELRKRYFALMKKRVYKKSTF
ncbi:flippase [Robertmurraya massiliosenegalensis]|uniref:flippase n=1 Tax=Robertmurraya TaxID=2837507 RepID=UPI0039A50BE6